MQLAIMWIEAQYPLTSLLTMSSKSGILTSALTRGILSTSSGKGLCLTLYLIPTPLLGVGRPSGTNTCCGKREANTEQSLLIGGTDLKKFVKSIIQIFLRDTGFTYLRFYTVISNVISPSDWPELLLADGKAALSKHVCLLSLGSKLSLMDWGLLMKEKFSLTEK